MVGFKKNSGRNINGFITVRNKVNKTNRKYVSINFLLVNKAYLGLSVCINIIQDANRTAFVSLFKNANGSFYYSITPHGIFNGVLIQTLNKPELFTDTYKVGFNVPIKYLPQKSIFFNVSSSFNTKSIYARSGGVYCVLITKDLVQNVCKIKLPSGSYIYIDGNSFVTIGRASNIYNNKVIVGKAGRNILKGKRSSVRGVAMNPVDHPHGGRTKTNSPELTP